MTYTPKLHITFQNDSRTILESRKPFQKAGYNGSGMLRTFGQVPTESVPPSLTNPVLINPAQTAQEILRHTGPVLTAAGLTANLALPPAQAAAFQNFAQEQLQTAANELELRQKLAQHLMYDPALAKEPALRRALMDRALSYYRHAGRSVSNAERLSQRAQGLRQRSTYAEQLSGPSLQKAQHTPSFVLEKSGPYIGPRGGKWADPQHKIPWETPNAHAWKGKRMLTASQLNKLPVGTQLRKFYSPDSPRGYSYTRVKHGWVPTAKLDDIPMASGLFADADSPLEFIPHATKPHAPAPATPKLVIKEPTKGEHATAPQKQEQGAFHFTEPAPKEDNFDTMPEPEPAPVKAPKPKTEQAPKPKAAPKKPDAKNRQQARTAGAHIPRSRKDMADLRAALDKGDLGEMLSSGKITHAGAAKLINKKSLMPVLTLEDYQEQGATAGAAHLALAMTALVAAKPKDSGAAREGYRKATRLVVGGLKNVRTMEDIDTLVSDIRELYTSAGGEVVEKSHDFPYNRVEELNRGSPMGVEYVSDVQRGGGYFIRKVDLVAQDSIRSSLDSLGSRFIDQLGIAAKKHGMFYLGKTWAKAKSTARSLEKGATDAAAWDKLSAMGEHDDAKKAQDKADRKQKTAARAKQLPWKREVADIPDLQGTAMPVEPGDGDEHKLEAAFNLNGVQPGENITNKDLQHHTRFAQMALGDLASVLGVPPDHIALSGRLSLAIAARGEGSTAAHYEPDTKAINLTSRGGAGSLAHEWGHFLDNIIGEAHIPASTSAEGDFATDSPQHLPDDLKAALHGVLAAMKDGSTDSSKARAKGSAKRLKLKAEADEAAAAAKSYGDQTLELRKQGTLSPEDKKKRRTNWLSMVRSAELAEIDYVNARKAADKDPGHSVFFLDSLARDRGKPSSFGQKNYWQSPTEMFARAFEAFVQDELEDNDRRNSYLVDGTRGVYIEGPKNAHGDTSQPYPQGVERTRINKAMRALVDVLKKGDHLTKALAALNTKAFHILENSPL